MFKKALAWATMAVCLGFSMSSWGSNNVTVVSISADVDAIIEWDDGTPYTVDIGSSAHITAVGQSQSATTTMALRSNAVNGCTISVAGTGNAGILTGPGGDVLTTKFNINGAGVKPADRDGAGTFVATGSFFGKPYEIPYVSAQGTYQVILGAQATAPTTRAPNSGNYTCTVTITAVAL